MKGKTAIIDSSIYIDLFRYGWYQVELNTINKNFIIRNSAVVLLELRAGAIETTVITNNASDFETIKKIRPFHLIILR